MKTYKRLDLIGKNKSWRLLTDLEYPGDVDDKPALLVTNDQEFKYILYGSLAVCMNLISYSHGIDELDRLARLINKELVDEAEAGQLDLTACGLVNDFISPLKSINCSIHTYEYVVNHAVTIVVNKSSHTDDIVTVYQYQEGCGCLDS